MTRASIMKVACAALAAAVFFGGLALAGERFLFFKPDFKSAEYDLATKVPNDALYFKGYDDTPYFDSLYYQFDMDDGSDFFCHIFLADMGMGLKRYGMDYKLTTAQGEPIYFGSKIDAEDATFSANSFDWKIGDNRVSGDRYSHRLVLKQGPLDIDVTMKTLVPFYRVGEGKLCLTRKCEREGTLTFFPLFKVEGAIEKDGKKIEVNGWGYGNRLIQEWNVTDMSNLHTALRWQKDGIGFDVHDYVTPEDLGSEWLPVLMVYKDGKMIHVSQDYEKEVLKTYKEPRSGKVIPADYRVVSEGGGVKVTIEFTDVKLTDYNDPLIVLSTVEKYLVELVAESPLDLRFDGKVKLTVETAGGTVVKEGPGHGLALVSK